MLKYLRILNDNYVLYNDIINVEPFTFSYIDPDSGRQENWGGGFMYECLVFKKTEDKFTDFRKLFIENITYKKISKLDSKARIEYLAELNSDQLNKVRFDINYWEGSETLQLESSQRKDQIKYLEKIVVKYSTWFKNNNQVVPKVEFVHGSKNQKKIIWNLSEQKLRLLLELCTKRKLIESTKDFESYVANFVSEYHTDFVKCSPKKIKWLKANTDLIYLIYHLSSRGIIESKDKWITTSNVFLNNNSRSFNNKSLSTQFDQIKNIQKSRKVLDQLISELN